MNDVFKPAGLPNTPTRASLLELNQPLRRTNHGTKGKSTSEKNNNYKIIPTPCPSTHPNINQPPPNLSHPPIIYNNYTIDDSWNMNLRLGSGVGPWVSIPCFLKDTSYIYWIHLSWFLFFLNQFFSF